MLNFWLERLGRFGFSGSRRDASVTTTDGESRPSQGSQTSNYSVEIVSKSICAQPEFPNPFCGLSDADRCSLIPNHSVEIDPTSIHRKSEFPNAFGGLADVYKCSLIRDTSSEEVAVKSPRFPSLGEADTDKVNRLLDRETRVWSELEHEYILPLRGTVKGFGPFRALVSPWMQNGTLTSYLGRKDVALTMRDKLLLLKRIAEGLAYLHNFKDVNHSDLTSNNILVASDGSPRLADFGISNIVVASKPEFSSHIGAVPWTAPELINSPEDVQCTTKSSDIYSFGCIMLHVLYGKLPYWWIGNVLQVIGAKFTKQEPINDTIDIPTHYLEFMRRCWSIDRERRPSVMEVLDFLEKAMSSETDST